MATTTYDFMAQQLMTPEKQQAFCGDPEGFVKLFHFTKDDTHTVYPYIDPAAEGNKERLSQAGKVVLVTGAGRGIGKSVALTFAKANAKGVILWARSLDQLEAVKKEINDLYPEVKVHVEKVDVSLESEVDAAFQRGKDAIGPVDVAVHNAGVNNDVTLLGDAEPGDWWKHFEVHVKGLFLLARRFVSKDNLPEGKTGTFIQMSSSSALAGIPTQAAYGPSKLAADRVIGILGMEYPQHRFFSLHPGVCDTELNKKHRITELYAWTIDAPELAGCTTLWLTTPEAEFLRGRWIAATWRMDQLVERAKEIVQGGLLMGGICGQLGVQ